MTDDRTRDAVSSLIGEQISDPVHSAVQSAENTRVASGKAQLTDYSCEDGDGIPVQVVMSYRVEDGESEWIIQVTVPQINGERRVTKSYDDKFTATAVFEWLVANYGLEMGCSDSEETDEDMGEPDTHETASSGVDYS